MGRKQKKTAGEHMAELESDPAYRQIRDDKAQRRFEREARLRALEEPILADLRAAGLTVDSVYDLLPAHFPLPSQVVQILLKWLPLVSDNAIKESIIRTLIGAREPYDGQPLVDCFTADRSETLRFPIANTIAYSFPTGIAAWLVERAQERRFGSDRQILLLALARHVPRETAIPILRQALEDVPGGAAKALAEIGGLPEAELLETRLHRQAAWEHKWIPKEIEKAIRKIRKRAEREAKKQVARDKKRRGK
jgi:hypothetical protein